jgi:hypothetical protein
LTVTLRAITRLLKNGHLLRFPHPSSLQRPAKYASLLRILGALHLVFLSNLEKRTFSEPVRVQTKAVDPLILDKNRFQVTGCTFIKNLFTR